MTETVLDVRTIAPWDRHTEIFGVFDDLPVGDVFVLINDHDPRPLYHQFLARHQGGFIWTYLDKGPDLWRIRIDKSEPSAPEGSSCCGHCGG